MATNRFDIRPRGPGTANPPVLVVQNIGVIIALKPSTFIAVVTCRQVESQYSVQNID